MLTRGEYGPIDGFFVLTCVMISTHQLELCFDNACFCQFPIGGKQGIERHALCFLDLKKVVAGVGMTVTRRLLHQAYASFTVGRYALSLQQAACKMEFCFRMPFVCRFLQQRDCGGKIGRDLGHE